MAQSANTPADSVPPVLGGIPNFSPAEANSNQPVAENAALDQWSLRDVSEPAKSWANRLKNSGAGVTSWKPWAGGAVALTCLFLFAVWPKSEAPAPDAATSLAENSPPRPPAHAAAGSASLRKSTSPPPSAISREAFSGQPETGISSGMTRRRDATTGAPQSPVSQASWPKASPTGEAGWGSGVIAPEAPSQISSHALQIETVKFAQSERDSLRKELASLEHQRQVMEHARHKELAEARKKAAQAEAEFFRAKWHMDHAERGRRKGYISQAGWAMAKARQEQARVDWETAHNTLKQWEARTSPAELKRIEQRQAELGQRLQAAEIALQRATVRLHEIANSRSKQRFAAKPAPRANSHSRAGQSAAFRSQEAPGNTGLRLANRPDTPLARLQGSITPLQSTANDHGDDQRSVSEGVRR